MNQQPTDEPDEPAVISQPQPSQRREVEYSNLTAFIKDAEFLAKHPHKTVGNWSFGKILQHLTESFNKSFDGFNYKANIFIRIAAPFMKNRFLNNPMPSGFKLPKDQEANLPPDSTDVATALANVRQAVARFEKEAPQAAHPAFGKMTPEEWVKLHLRHCELHMSFVKPA